MVIFSLDVLKVFEEEKELAEMLQQGSYGRIGAGN